MELARSVYDEGDEDHQYEFEWREQVIFFGNIDNGNGKFHSVKILPKPSPVDLRDGSAFCLTKEDDPNLVDGGYVLDKVINEIKDPFSGEDVEKSIKV